MSNRIKLIEAREILDSRGNPTLEAAVTLESGAYGAAAVPSGASVGKHEAWELRDGDPTRFGGGGVLCAVKNVNGRICSRLVGMEADRQREIDGEMIRLDGDSAKRNLGANAILAVSLAVARAAADHYSLPLYAYLGGIRSGRAPMPMMNILNGGAHAGNNLDFQEFMIVPIGAENATRGVVMCAEVYKKLGELLTKSGHERSVGDEGGYAPNLGCDEDACRLICEAIEQCGYGGKIKLALDVAASEWHKGGRYVMTKSGKECSAEELTERYCAIAEQFPVLSIEDGLGEDDFDGWKRLTDELGDKVRLVGDDLFVTNRERLRLCAERGIANTALVKPNQIGTLSETLDYTELAATRGYGLIMSHRSGDTPDSFITDLAVACHADYLKAGAPARGERVAKYNRLMQIEAEIG